MEDKTKRVNILKTCIGKGQPLQKLAEYATDSIVSKTILDSSIGTITLFAFDTGQKLSEHTSPYNAVVQVVDGCGMFIIGNNSLKISAGELLIMPANIPHSVHANKKFKMLLIMVRA
jgi:quercetin dioxygenase-like cupin family protein